LADERALKLARSAREQLGEALGTLQMEELPLSLFDVTAQVAKAMSLLLRFEQSGDGRIAEQALLAVRTTLGVLQTCSPRLPAVDKSAQAVAGALGLVHSVNELAALPAAAVHAAGQSAKALGPERGKTQIGHGSPVGNPDTTDTLREPLSGRSTSDALRAQNPQPATAPEANTTKSASASVLSTRQVSIHKETLVGAGPEAARAAVVPAIVPESSADIERKAAREHRTEPEPRRALGAPPSKAGAPGASKAASAGAPAAPENDNAGKAVSRATLPVIPEGAHKAGAVNVSLGAHSASNFFTGLAGVNVVEKGGLFIATYDVAPVGKRLEVVVALPGGTEFGADAVVLWQRDPARHTSPGLPPGYGVKFTRISEAGRKLIDRYVAHREPFFYDEL
jgi:uncharacterized protein (TIGR02266 family)